MTPEKRAARLDEGVRVQLLVVLSNRVAARRQVEQAERELREAVTAAIADGASFRDVASLLGLPHQSVHQLVRPYKRGAA